ncbi:MAG: DUF4416 family protein [Synergistaceae bacterium]|jgi:hypothetical protein|nr:DUF4416 family protein [Synergistaceae bacterium]
MKDNAAAPLVKLICGLLYPSGEPELMEWARAGLTGIYGPIERESASFDFCYTDYYRDISRELSRRFFSFESLTVPKLVRWKKAAVALELSSAEGYSGVSRRINADPGYIDGARLVLASTKDNAHRIYIGEGIFAEVTLCRRKSGWESFPYTFPDFAGGIYDAFLETVRQDWLKQIREQRRRSI